MRWAHKAASAAVVAIALYFAVLWATDAVRVFASSTYGLDGFRPAQEVFSVGQTFGLGWNGLFRLSAFIGAFKLVGAVAFALHLADRVRGYMAGRAAEDEMLEAGLVLVMLLVLAMALPAVAQGNAVLLRGYGLSLLLASVALMLNIHERRAREGATAPSSASNAPSALQRAIAEARAQLPPLRSSIGQRILRIPLLRRIAVLIDLFVRRWTDDFYAVTSGEAPRPRR